MRVELGSPRFADPPESAVYSDAQKAPDADGLLDAGEVAGLLGVPVSWVYEQSRRGRIPTVTLGRYRRYRRDSVEAWIRGLEGQPARQTLRSSSKPH